jgi:hypothetical protein
MSDAVINTLIGTLGSLVVAYLGYRGVLLGIDRAKKRRAAATASPEDETLDEEAALVKYENNPAKFVHDVLADNALQRGYALEWERRYQESQKAAEEERREMRERYLALESKFDAQARRETRFRDALVRYLVDIFAAWGTTPAMPAPRAADADILSSVIPTQTGG